MGLDAFLEGVIDRRGDGRWVLELPGAAKTFECSTVSEQKSRVQAGMADEITVDGSRGEPATVAERCVDKRLAIKPFVLADE